MLQSCREDLSVLAPSEYTDALVQITGFLGALLEKCRG
jgi:hypothetical protein